MKMIIQFAPAEELRAIPIILRDSPGAILPDRTYILTEKCVQRLHDAGIKFTELSRESHAPSLEATEFGERV